MAVEYSGPTSSGTPGGRGDAVADRHFTSFMLKKCKYIYFPKYSLVEGKGEGAVGRVHAKRYQVCNWSWFAKTGGFE